MSPDTLFLRRCEQVATFVASNDQIDLLDLSGTLSQLLCDRHSLVDVANTDKLKITFQVGTFEWEPDEYTDLLLLEDGLDPDTARPGKQTMQLTKAQFLGHPIIWAEKRWHTVNDVIGHARNVAGGRHYDPHNKKERYQALKAAASQIEVGGHPVSVRQLQAIGRVTLKALAPLIKAVRARHA